MKKYIYIIGMIRGAFFLLCMMLCSTVAWAQDGGDPDPVLTPAQKLIKALTEGTDATVEYALTEDVSLTETIELNANKTITLDLAGHSIVATGHRALWIKSGSVTITSAVAGGTISVVNSIDNIDRSVIRVGDEDNTDAASLVIDENVTIKTDLCYGVTVFGTNASTLTVNGKIATKVRSAVSGNGSAGLAPTTITIGEKAELTTDNEVAIYHPQAGTLTVKGGAKVTGAGGIEMKGGELVVEEDAEIKATDAPTHTAKNDDPSTRGYAIAIVESGAGYPGVSTVNISKDAKIVGEIAVLQDSEHADAPEIQFAEGGLQMQVKVTNDGKIIGQYMSLNEAFREGIPAGSTITLYGDCSLTSTITTNDNFTLDLNGHNITSNGQRAFHIQSGDVIIKSTGAGGVISVPTIDNNDKSVIRVGSDDASAGAVSLTVENGVTISTDVCYGITIFGKNTPESLVVNGKVDTKVRSAISGNGSAGFAPTTITIGSTAEITTTDDAAIYHPQAGPLTVESGAKVTGSTGIEMKGGTLEVASGAVITATGTPSHTKNNDGTSTRGYAIAIVENNAGYGAGAGVTAVTIAADATINGVVSQLQDSSIGSSFNPTVTRGGVPLTTIAAIDGVKFFTLKEAIDIVPVNGTVALLGDLTLTSPFKMDVNKTYTFDLAGHTLIGSGCAAIQVAGGSVTIDNSGSVEKTISVSSGAPAVILLGDDAGDNRNVSLTINNKVKVESTVSDGILVSGIKTRETLIVKGSIAASGYAIKGADQSEKIEVAAGGSVSSSGAIAIYHPQSGDLVIEGTVQGTGGIEMKGGNLTVNAGAKITATAGATSHTPNAAAPSTNGYAIALVENENFPGVGKVNIKSAATITGVIANLVDSENTQVAATVFNGDIVMVAETKNANNFAERYAKLSDAVTAALAGADVKIIDDIIVTETVGINKAVKLIMNDHSIIGKQTSGSTLAISGDATLEDGGIIAEQGEGISISGGTVSLNQMTVKAAGSSLSVSGGTVTADKKSSFTSSTGNTVAFSGGTLTMSGAVYNTASTAVAAIAATGTAGANNTDALTIKDKAVVSSANGNAIDWQNAGTLNITSGNVISDKTIAIYANSGTVNINGGTFTGKVNALKIDGVNCTPSVAHGTFSSTEEDPIISTDKKNFVQGDYFSKPIKQSLCASGYTVAPNPKSNGMFYLINEIVITDATHWIVRDDDYTIGTAKYVRSSGMGVNGTKFGTLCLPFSFSATQTRMKFYAVSEIKTEAEVLILKPVTGTTIEAGTPVVFQLTEAAQGFEIESENATIPGGETYGYPKPANNLVGTYTNTDITEGLTSIYYLNGDAFHKAAAKLTVPAFRAYIKLDSGSGTGAKSRTLAIRIEGEDATGIDNNMIDLDTFEEVYDMQGRKQDGLQKGMNIMRTKDGRTIKVYVNK